MPQVTSVEQSLKRMVTMCPDITLDKRAIQLIIDGNMNQVISEYLEIAKTIADEAVNSTITSSNEPTVSGENITWTGSIDIKSTSLGQSFDEYFK